MLIWNGASPLVWRQRSYHNPTSPFPGFQTTELFQALWEIPSCTTYLHYVCSLPSSRAETPSHPSLAGDRQLVYNICIWCGNSSERPSYQRAFSRLDEPTSHTIEYIILFRIVSMRLIGERPAGHGDGWIVLTPIKEQHLRHGYINKTGLTRTTTMVHWCISTRVRDSITVPLLYPSSGFIIIFNSILK